jgi:hypothetical protein
MQWIAQLKKGAATQSDASDAHSLAHLEALVEVVAGTVDPIVLLPILVACVWGVH